MPTWFFLAFFPALSLLFLFAKFGVVVILSRRYFKRRGWITEGGMFGRVPETVTVIVPAYNEELTIGNALHSLEQQTFSGLEVLVVNDGSTDNTAAVATEIAKTLSVPTRVLSKPNGGKADALNHGLAHAQTELVLCVDADSALAPDAIEHVVEPFADPSVGATGGVIKIANRSSLGGRLQAVEYISSLMLLRAAFAELEAIQILSGPISAFRTADLRLAGGYSDDTIVEDFDVTVAMHKAGHKVLFHPGAVAYTEGPQTLRDFVKQRTRWSYGGYQVLYKHRKTLFTRRMGRLSMFGLPYFLVIPWADVLVALMGVVTLVESILTDDPLFFLLYMGVVSIVIFLSLDLYAMRLANEDRRLAVWGILAPLCFQPVLAFVVVKTAFQFLLRREARWGQVERQGSNALPVGIYDFIGVPPEEFKDTEPEQQIVSPEEERSAAEQVDSTRRSDRGPATGPGDK